MPAMVGTHSQQYVAIDPSRPKGLFLQEGGLMTGCSVPNTGSNCLVVVRVSLGFDVQWPKSFQPQNYDQMSDCASVNSEGNS